MKLYTEERKIFEDLSWLEGMALELIRGPFESHPPDGRVMMLKDYPNAILVEMEYLESKWGLQIGPRHIRLMIPKASLYCGDVILKIRSTKQIVTGEMVYKNGGTK